MQIISVVFSQSQLATCSIFEVKDHPALTWTIPTDLHKNRNFKSKMKMRKKGAKTPSCSSLGDSPEDILQGERIWPATWAQKLCWRPAEWHFAQVPPWVSPLSRWQPTQMAGRNIKAHGLVHSVMRGERANLGWWMSIKQNMFKLFEVTTKLFVY